MPSKRSAEAVLVVGGAGYLGCVLVEELLARGYHVKVFDRLFFGDRGLSRMRDRVQLLTGDMRAMPPEAFDNVRSVINLGGLSNDPTAEYNPNANHQMNTVATEKLALLCKQRKISRYVFASSASVYDVGVIDEEREVLQDETSAIDPRAAYAVSKLNGERALMALRDDHFHPTILRMGTLFGFSPRMRYDLVVNTFTKDAMSKGSIQLHRGGEMWRPLCDVRDAARAYVAVLEGDLELVSGQVFNVVNENFRISEVGLRVQNALAEAGIKCEIKSEYAYSGVRNYRITGSKIYKVLGYRPVISLHESVDNMVKKIREYGYSDFDNDRYYNIRWMKLLEEARDIIAITGGVFEEPSSDGELFPELAKRVK
jgi:nucleoside-diphosphate-sugar epimerase